MENKRRKYSRKALLCQKIQVLVKNMLVERLLFSISLQQIFHLNLLYIEWHESWKWRQMAALNFSPIFRLLFQIPAFHGMRNQSFSTPVVINICYAINFRPEKGITLIIGYLSFDCLPRFNRISRLGSRSKFSSEFQQLLQNGGCRWN